jgi:hypothetical protein
MTTFLPRHSGLLTLLGAFWLTLVLSACGLDASSLLTGSGGDGGADVATGSDASHPPRDAHADGDNGCGTGKILCGHECTDPETDDSNCGRCGNICGAGLTCNRGACGCPTGFLFCEDTCIDTQNDPNHCGSCSNVCPAGTPCGGGVCGCGAPTTLCGSACVNEKTDPQHCGSCNNICGAGLSCMNGTCGCQAGELFCAGACTDTTSDPSNCGACNHVCGAGRPCVGGTCGCPAGETNCGEGIGCVDLTSNPTHCGDSCPGSVCASPLTCQSASCTCPDFNDSYCPLTNSCVDLTSDPENCGSCGASCGTESCVGSMCQNPNACTPPFGVCPAPYTCLNSGMCGCDPSTPDYCVGTNSCVDLGSDPENCGTCGHSCGAQTCVGGTCSASNTCTLANNAACTPGAMPPNPCCAPGPGVICGDTEVTFGTSTTDGTFANLCCITSGQACDDVSNGTCCGYMVCNGATCACQPQGQHCVNTADCCGMTCSAQHICGQTCVASGIGCELGDVCCVAGTTTPGEACPVAGVCP